MVLEIDNSYHATHIPPYPSPEDKSLIPDQLWSLLVQGWIRVAEQHLIRVSDDNQRVENADILEISAWLDSYLKNTQADTDTDPKLNYLVYQLCLTCPFGVVLKPQSAWRFVLRYYAKNSRPVLNLLGGNPDLAEIAAMGLLEHARAFPKQYTQYYDSNNKPSNLVVLRSLLDTGNKDKLEPLSQLFVGQKWLVNTLAAFPTETSYSALTEKQKDLAKALLYIVSTCLLSIPYISYFEKLMRSALFLDLKKKYHLAAVLLCATNFIDLIQVKFSQAAGFQGVLSVLNIERDRLSEKPQLRFPVTKTKTEEFAITETAGPSSAEPSDADAHTIMDMFPQFNLGQAKTLIDHHVTTEGAMEYILSNPNVLENPSSIPEWSSGPEPSQPALDDYAPMPVLAAQSTPKYIFGKKEISTSLNPDEDAKSANLQHALRMIYESDEDERDDTYEGMEGATEEDSQANAKLDKIQQYLFQLYSSNRQVFDKLERKSKARAELKKTTEWSDEQIEGWARMLERNPRQFKMLESKQLEMGVSKNDKPVEEKKEKEKKGKEPERQMTPEQAAARQKQKQARDRRHKTQNKSSTHHRKSAHDRKMGKANFD
ncbi:CUE domain-containing protein 3 [Yarrowia sp. B02]|nr:CUE domain-containing protein 3 [Yarrowia sp. B02]